MTACVIIQLSGAGQEKLLNRMAQEGLALWNAQRTDGGIRFQMTARDFFRLHSLRRGLYCRIHVAGRRGIAFPLLRLFRRRALWISAVAALLLLVAASTRIWSIEISGCSRVAEETVLRALAAEGLRIGARNAGYDLPRLNDVLRTYDERIAWIGLDLDGVILRVDVEETTREVTIPETEVPADVVAHKDGVILSVTAAAGRAAVRPGDAVSAGDLLIAGDLTREDAQFPLLVHAAGVVRANVAYFSEAAVGREGTAWADTGRSAPYRAVTLAGIRLFESDVPFEDYVLRDCTVTRLTDAVLPLTVATGVCFEQTERAILRTTEEMAEAALFAAEQGAYLRIPKDARIVDKQSNWLLLDEVVLAVVGITTEETIGITKEMTIDGKQDGTGAGTDGGAERGAG